ncbi:MAG: DUF3999 domain-containing protein [Pseudomonadota bacterium]
MQIATKSVLALLFTNSLLWLSMPLFADSFKLEAEGGYPLYRSDIPLEVYRSTRQDTLGDITIRNAANERVPHVLLEQSLVHPPAAATDNTLKLPLFALPADALHHTTASRIKEVDTKEVDIEQLRIQLEKNSGKTTVSISQGTANTPGSNSLYLLDAGEKHEPISKLTLDWTQAGASMLAMQVLASEDLNTWSAVGRGILLRTANEAGSILQNTIILDTPSKARYLQLRSGDTAQAFTLTSAEAHFSTLLNEQARSLWQPLKDARREDDAKSGLTTVEFEASGRFPAEFLRINLADDNTIATVRISVRNKADAPWRNITSASLYRMTERGANGQANTLTNPDITIYPTVARYWQLQFNQATGSIGASSPGLTLGWPVQTLVWNARGSGPFSLQTGTASTVNHVTIESLIPGFKPEKLRQLPIAVITPDKSAGNASTPPVSTWESADPVDKKRWWLWGGLVLGVLILAGMALSLLRSATPKADTHSPGRDD